MAPTSAIEATGRAQEPQEPCAGYSNSPFGIVNLPIELGVG
jgi:hypothetical protein